MRLSAFPAAVVALMVLAAPVPRAQTEHAAVTEIIARAGAYVAHFEEQFSGIVAEERYVQDSIPSSTYIPGVRGNSRQHRELKSDLLLVRPKGADHWVQFRDVFEVDGQPVRDRGERLTRLFLSPLATIGDQAWAIANESARYNIGSLQRNTNVPVLPLLFLDAEHQERFEFTQGAALPPGRPGRPVTPRDVPSRSSFAVPPDTSEVRYREVKPETLIRTTNDRDMPSSGRFWIEPSTGRVLMTEFLLEDPFIRAAIYVSYQSKPIGEFLVPVEMREDYLLTTTKTHITGAATYSKFRQFQVNVDEKMLLDR